MATKQFTTRKRERKLLTFEVDEVEYHFDPPKMAAAIMPVLDPGGENGDGDSRVSMTQATWGWLREGLPEDEYELLMDRLRDPEDDFDVNEVTEIVRWLIGQASGRPTTSRRG